MLFCHCIEGWREVPGLSTCLVPDDQPHTAVILAFLVEVPDLGSELHPSHIFVILLYYMMLPSNGNIFLRWWPFVRGPPVTGWFPSQWLVTQSFDLHCACGCSGPTRAKPVKVKCCLLYNMKKNKNVHLEAFMKRKLVYVPAKFKTLAEFRKRTTVL